MYQWDKVDARARTQHGVVTKAQLRALGMTEHDVRRAVAAGMLIPIHRGVYRLAGAPATWHQSLMAAVAAGGTGAAASHRSAAQLWGLLPGDQPFDIVVPRRRSPQVRGATVHRSVDLDARWIRRRAGVSLTDPLRTMVDLGAAVPAATVSDAMERGVTSRLFTVAALEWAQLELGERGRNGCGVLGSVLDERALGAAPADGLLEPRFARLCRIYGVQMPVFHHVVCDERGRFVAEVDFAYPEIRLFVEVDGYEVHGTPRALTKDLDRQNRLVALGWTPLRFTWSMVVRQPDRVASHLLTVLGSLRAT